MFSLFLSTFVCYISISPTSILANSKSIFWAGTPRNIYGFHFNLHILSFNDLYRENIYISFPNLYFWLYKWSKRKSAFFPPVSLSQMVSISLADSQMNLFCEKHHLRIYYAHLCLPGINEWINEWPSPHVLFNNSVDSHWSLS